MKNTSVTPGAETAPEKCTGGKPSVEYKDWEIARQKMVELTNKNTHFTWDGTGKLPNDQRVHLVGVEGGVEGLSLLLRTFHTLSPPQVKVKEDLQTDEQKQHATNLINSVQNLFINMVVVGALLMSITGPMVMEPPAPGGKSLEAFGETIVFWLEMTYALMISMSFVASAVVTYATVRFYTHLTFWLVSQASKVRYIEHAAPVTYIVLLSMFSFGTMMVAIGISCIILDCYKAIPVALVLISFFYQCFWLEISNKAPGQMAGALLMRDVVDTLRAVTLAKENNGDAKRKETL